MVKNIFLKVKDFVLTPSKAFEAEKKSKLGQAAKYAAFGLFVLGLLGGIASFFISPEEGPSLRTLIDLFGVGGGIIGLIGVIVGVILIGLLLYLIKGLWVHMWAYAFGAREGVEQTLKLVMYAQTPFYYLGWIPFVNLVAAIWVYILTAIGLTQLQKMSAGKAVVAVLIATIIPLTIILLLLYYFIKTVGVEI